MLGWPQEIVRNTEITMPQPGLFGLVLISVLLGGLAACLVGRPRGAFVGMVGAVLAGLTTPWAADAAGLTIRSIWALVAAMLLMALLAVAVWRLASHTGSRPGHRRRPVS